MSQAQQNPDQDQAPYPELSTSQSSPDTFQYQFGADAPDNAATDTAAESAAAATAAASVAAGAGAAAASASGAGPSEDALDDDLGGKRSLLREIFSKRMGICMVTGFASGMPLFVLINLLAAYLRKEGLDLKVIGAFSLMMIPYTWKFVWAPFIDRYQIFSMGRRRGWIILSQVILTGSIAAMGFVNPRDSIMVVAALATLVAFASATQDLSLIHI